MESGTEKQTALRAGIVGAGLMGRWHAEAIRRAGGKLVAIVDIDAAKASQFARRFPGAEIFSAVEPLLQRKNFDVLHICTPLSTHLSIAEAAIDNGIHLLVEKPLTATAAETERLYHRAAQRGVLLCPVHQFLFQDGIRKAERLLSAIGNLVHVEATFCSAGGDGVSDGELDAIVADILPHPLSLFERFLPGGLLDHWTTLHSQAGELRSFCETGAATAAIFISMKARPTACALQLSGTEGTITVDMFHGYAFFLSGKVSRARKVMQPFDRAMKRFSSASVNLAARTLQWRPAYPGLERLVHLFYQAVQKQAAMPVSPESAIAVARVRDLLIESAGLNDKQIAAR